MSESSAAELYQDIHEVFDNILTWVKMGGGELSPFPSFLVDKHHQVDFRSWVVETFGWFDEQFLRQIRLRSLKPGPRKLANKDVSEVRSQLSCIRNCFSHREPVDVEKATTLICRLLKEYDPEFAPQYSDRLSIFFLEPSHAEILKVRFLEKLLSALTLIENACALTCRDEDSFASWSKDLGETIEAIVDCVLNTVGREIPLRDKEFLISRLGGHPAYKDCKDESKRTNVVVDLILTGGFERIKWPADVSYDGLLEKYELLQDPKAFPFLLLAKSVAAYTSFVDDLNRFDVVLENCWSEFTETLKNGGASGS